MNISEAVECFVDFIKEHNKWVEPEMKESLWPDDSIKIPNPVYTGKAGL
jgi:hypothetical protein